MRKTVKQVVGIDVAQDELVVKIGKMYDDWTPEEVAHKTFANQPKKFAELQQWVKAHTDAQQPVRYVMEATGVYHQKLSYWLYEQGLPVSIVLPNKISNYARTLSVKTVTDKTAASAILLFGLERKLDDWEPPKGIYKKLQQLTRERSQLVEERTMIKNQVHAEQAEAVPNKQSVIRAQKRIALLDKQEKEIEVNIRELLQQDEEGKRIVMLLCTIPGIGLLTAATILGETNGFELIKNKRQLTSYAGLDVKEKQSGTSVKGIARISKRGNRHLRKCLHLPALNAIRRDERFKAVFARVVARHGIKMKAVVSVQRRLLEMAFTVFKANRPYDKEYLKAAETKQAAQ
jgi:transposase